MELNRSLIGGAPGCPSRCMVGFSPLLAVVRTKKVVAREGMACSVLNEKVGSAISTLSSRSREMEGGLNSKDETEVKLNPFAFHKNRAEQGP